MLMVWSVLLAGRAFAGGLGHPTAVLIAFTLATVLVWRTRPRPAPGGAQPAPWVHRAVVPLLGLVAGYLLLPAGRWIAVQAGSAVGLYADPLGAAPLWREPALWVATVVLAPAFEEPLYRERLLTPLRERLGAPLAIFLTSLLFAASHVAPWAVLTTFFGGLLLGAVMHLGRLLTLCITLHMGMNLSIASPGTLSVLPGALLAAAALGAALWLSRRSSEGALGGPNPRQRYHAANGAAFSVGGSPGRGRWAERQAP